MSSFFPTQAELGLVNQVFAIADPQKVGIITGDAAVKVFAGSKLSPAVLGEIWAIADKENNGFLTKNGAAIATRLIAHAQKGEVVKESLLEKVCALAHIEGVSPASSTAPAIPLNPPTSTLPREGHLPALTVEDKAKFLRLFVGCGPVNGLLSGEKARDVFIKSKLSVEKLSQIWSLADTQDRGSLDQTDFTIAMYLIQALMSKQTTSLPTTLPQWLYEQAAGNLHPSIQPHLTGTTSPLMPSLTGSFSASTHLTQQNTGGARVRLQPQITGQERYRASIVASPTLSSASATLGATAFGQLPASIPWDVTLEEKNRFDSLFDNLDLERRGFIEGDVAVPFMLESMLSEDVLAQVWDLADINKDGRLTRDGFAVAMHLIQSRLSGKAMPPVLPSSLVPPSMRKHELPKQSSAPAASYVSGPMQDLLWEDSPPASASGTKPTSPFASSTNNSQPIGILQPQSTGQFSQLRSNWTGTGSPFGTAGDPSTIPAAAASPRFNGVQRDLLDDDDDVARNAVPDNSAEIGNIGNQISSTTRSLGTTKAERQSIETSIISEAKQLSSLQTQLASAKAAYETEIRLLDTLRERFSKQSTDIKKAQEELIRAESDLSAVRVEKTEIEGNLLRDKEEVRNLQHKIKELGEEIESLKGSIEKAKRETKHQKGLLAIAKKQLATKEAERAKAAKDLEQAERDVKEATKEMNTMEAILHEDPGSVDIDIPPSASQHPVPRDTDTPSIAAKLPLPSSPLSSPSSFDSNTSLDGNATMNNPFERLIRTSSRPPSPFKEQVMNILPASIDHQPMVQDSPNASAFARKVEMANSHDAAPPIMSALAFITDSSASMHEPASSLAILTVPSNPFGLTQDKGSSIDEIADATAKTEEILVDTTASRFPEVLAAESVKQPGSGTSGDQTDLGQDLLEKVAEDSDSDEENDTEDIFHDAKESRQSFSSPLENAIKNSESEGNVMNVVAKDNAESKVQILKASIAFNDAFGLNIAPPGTVDQEEQNSVNNIFPSDLFSLPTQPVHKEIDPSKDMNVITTSGVSAFDEALGKISSPNVRSSAHFNLDSGFDDNFNFTAAKEELDSEPTQLQPSHFSTNLNGSIGNHKGSFAVASTAQRPTLKANEGTATSFDDIFGNVSAASEPNVVPTARDGTSLFDSAFGFAPTKAIPLGSGSNLDVTPQSLPEAQESGTSRIMQSPPISSMAIPTTAPSSTIHSSSPPLRTSSPKPRVSTGSSNEGSVHAKPAPPPRHSKLSIRLPFRKKKQEQPPLQQLPSLPTLSEPNKPFSVTEADDVETVKQLCSMGFERQRALAALEKHGYDVQRALNSLLGSG